MAAIATKMELWCAVVDDGSVFSVEIDPSARVQELQQKIVFMQRYDSVVASKLKLYAAKKNGAWLKDDDRDVRQLINSSECPKGLSVLMLKKTLMLPTRTVRESIAKMELPEPSATEEIHLLVQLPEAPKRKGSTEDTNRSNNLMLQQVMSKLNAMRKELSEKMDELAAEHKRREFVAFSDMTSEKRELLTKKLRLPVTPLKVVEPQVASVAASSPGLKIPAFRWVPSESQEKHALGYRAYVESHLKDTLEACDLALICVESNKSLLTIDDERLPFGLKGGTGMLILTNFGDDTEDMALLFPGLRIVIDVERDLTKNYEARFSQAIAQLIAVDLKTTGGEPAMLLLTDLQHSWVFLWLGMQCIHSLTLREPTNAFVFMRSALTKWDRLGTKGFSFPCFTAATEDGKRPYKRQKINQMRRSSMGNDEE